MILVIGAGGQVGQELVATLREKHGAQNVVASDIRESNGTDGPFEILNALDKERLSEIVDKYKIEQIYHLVALLSANAEKQVKFAWEFEYGKSFSCFRFSKG